MKTNIKFKIQQILNKIEYHDKKYHGEDNPEISDYEYDRLCSDYDKLIEKNFELNFLKRDKVGYLPSNQFKKYSHLKPMLSLNNGFSFRDAYLKISEDIKNGNYIPKKDFNHTLKGSIGNLCLKEIEIKMKKALN